MTRQPRRRRSVLYVPAANPKALAKAASLACDAVIFDLEDAVAPEAKDAARVALEAHFRQGDQVAGQERVIRVNAASSAWGAQDMTAAARCRPHAVLLPKVETGAALAEARRLLDGAGGAGVRLWAMIETPRGIVDLREIASVGARDDVGLDCLVAGTNDIAKETGLPLPAGRGTIEHWLALIVIHARAFGLDAVDGVYNDFRDEAGFAAECLAGALAGFDGKTLIHPGQIGPANAAFSPGEAALAEARAIVAAFAEPANAGKGVISVDGRMVELLHAEMARRTLAKAAS